MFCHSYMTFSQSHSLNKVMWACFTGEKALESVSYFKQVSFSITSIFTEESRQFQRRLNSTRPQRESSFEDQLQLSLSMWPVGLSNDMECQGICGSNPSRSPLRYMAVWSTNSWAITMLQHRSRVGNYYNTTRQCPSIQGMQTVTVQLNSQPRGDPYCLHNLSASLAQLNDLFQEHG